jgi:hypothetical protein
MVVVMVVQGCKPNNQVYTNQVFAKPSVAMWEQGTSAASLHPANVRKLWLAVLRRHGVCSHSMACVLLIRNEGMMTMLDNLTPFC